MRAIRVRFSLPLLFPKFWLFLNCHIDSAIAQCETGLEETCVWHHSVDSALRWQQKTDTGGEDSYVELSDCTWPDCGIGQIESPWMPAREGETLAKLRYKIYGTSRVWFRLQLKLEDELSPRQLFYKIGNYAYTYPEEWSEEDVRIPATHTNHQLLIKAYVPYKEAMVSVKGIALDRNLVLTSTQSSTISLTTTKSVMPPTSSQSTSTSTRTTSSTTTTTTTTTRSSSSSSSTTTTTTVIPVDNDDDGDYNGDDERTRNDFDYFPDDDDNDNEIERRFQALEVQNFIGEEDLTKGFTTVVKPQICMYR